MNNTVEALKKKGYKVTVFQNGLEAVEYLKKSIKGKTISFGGSQTLTSLGVKDALAIHNTIYSPDFPPAGETFQSIATKGMTSDVFLLSANAVSEDGDIVNIDGYGNRLSGSLFGHEKVYYIIGKNKIGGSLEEAIHRAKNTAAPKNALRLHRNTPCALAVKERLEEQYRGRFSVEGDIDQQQWESFISGLDDVELATHCYDCKSPERICSSLLVHMKKPSSMEAEVIVILEPLGF